MRRALVLIGLVLTAIAATARAEVVDIDNRQLQDLLARGVPIVDVRTPAEWRQTGVIEGSHLLMFFDEHGRYDAGSWVADLARIAKTDEPVIVICRTGNRTAQIAAYLDRQVGYSTVYNVRRGIKSWIAGGGKTTTATAPPTRH